METQPTPGLTPIGSATARYIAATRERRFAPEVVDAARMALVDWFAVAIGAWHEPAAQAMRATAEGMGGGDTASGDAAGGNGESGKAPLLLGGAAPPAIAALVNGTYAHCLDFDDTHSIASSHFTAPTWAAVFALATARQSKNTPALATAGQTSQHRALATAGQTSKHRALAAVNEIDEQQVLGAFITGFEVGARLSGRKMAPALHYRGFHPTAIFGRFAATAACAALLGLDEGQTAHALGLAATQCGGLNASLGTMAKPFHAGKAAMDSILAAQLAAEGFEGATDLLDSESGLIPTLIQDGEVTLEGVEFSDGLSLLDNGFKPYACCRSTHSAMDAALKLRGQLDGGKLDSGQVTRVRVEVHPVAVRVAGKSDPQTPLEAKFSIAFVTALGLAGHAGSPRDFAPDRVADPQLRKLSEVVELAVNPDFGRYATVMHVELEGGQALHMEVPSPLGNPDNPMSWAQMEAKFQGLVEPLLGEDTAALFQAARNIGQPGSLAEVARLVRGR